ncbi:hypothetical protein QQF64_028155, partial [Cirrhinus molitorella]
EEEDGDWIPLDFDRVDQACLIGTQSSIGRVVALHLDFDLFERPRPEERIQRSFDDAALWTALPGKRLIELGAAVFAVSASRCDSGGCDGRLFAALSHFVCLISQGRGSR